MAIELTYFRYVIEVIKGPFVGPGVVGWCDGAG